MSPTFRRLAEYEPPLGITEPPDFPHIPRPRWEPPAEPVPPPLDARHLVQQVIEVLDGRRPLKHLQSLITSQPLLGKLRRHTSTRSTRLLRVHVCHPSDRTAEITATIRRGPRYLAVAARATHRRKQWWITHFDVLS
jgi:hypothetical protein